MQSKCNRKKEKPLQRNDFSCMFVIPTLFRESSLAYLCPILYSNR